MWHIETDIFALIIFIIMLWKNLRMQGERDKQRNAIIQVLLASIFTCVIDLISSDAMNRSTNYLHYNASLTLYYATMPLVTAAWINYMMVVIKSEHPQGMNKWHVLSMMPGLFYVIIGLSNPWTGAFFTLTRDMQYSRGPLFWSLAIGFYTVYSVIGLLGLFLNWKYIKLRSNRLFLSTYFISSIIVPYIQTSIHGTLIIEISYAVLFILCDATVEEEKKNQLLAEIQEKNEALKEAADAANASNHAKSEFLSRMSHDIRTPINGILGMTYLAKEENNPPKTAEYLNKIDTSSKFLMGLINDVLDMSHMENSEIELKLEPYPIEELNAYIDAVIRPLCEEKGQKLILDEENLISDRCPLVDKLRCNQIIFNILSNAVKYTPEGGTIMYRLSEKMLPDGRVEVTDVYTDNGIGMSESFQKVLFEPFSQENRVDSSRGRGTGLGLSIVKKLVDRMGGTIQVKSQLGKGTTFITTMSFDTVPLESIEQNSVGSKPQGTVFDLSGKHILLCEDHPLNQEIAKILLEEKHCTVTIAEDGKIGLQKFQQASVNYYDAVLMDIRMPVMDGITATKEIRKLDRADAASVPIIAMTADAFVEDVKKCLDAGMNAHIAKPIDPLVLYQKLSKEIGKRHE